MLFERRIGELGEVSVKEVKSLDDPDFSGYDILVIAAQAIPDEDFPVWLKGIAKRIKSLGNIWTPALILTSIDFQILSDILAESAKENWYFDILDPQHMSSLPIRVANLIRIHDHLKELHRYEATLTTLEDKVRALEKSVADQS